jgi:hypothetical protein
MTGQNYGHSFPTHVERGKDARFAHGFAPGSYVVKASGTDPEGRSASWDLPVRAYPRLCPAVRVSVAGAGALRFRGSVGGGQGTVLAWRWLFSDGKRADGAVVRRHMSSGSAVLWVTDGTGTVASVRAPARAGEVADGCAAVKAVKRRHHAKARRRATHRHRRSARGRRAPAFTG